MKSGALSKNLQSNDPRRLLATLGMESIGLADWMKSLPPELLARFAANSVPCQLRAGEVLFHKGDHPGGLYFIESGEVRSSTITAEGEEFILYLFEPGSCVGLTSVLDGAPSPSTCRAWCDSRVRLLPRRELLAILEQHPQYYRHFNELLLRWVRGLLGLVEDQAILGLRARLAKRLLQLASLYGEAAGEDIAIPFRLPQEELGLLLGATRQSIHQQLNDFRGRGWITLRNGYFTLHDTTALADCAGGKQAPDSP